jgi:hypothetical protein
VENLRCIRNNKEDIFKTLQPFWTSGNRQSYYSLQSKSSFQTVHSKKLKHFSIKIYKLCDSTGYIWDKSVVWGGQTA